MKNVAHLRNFFIASLIVSFTVPLIYHTVLNYTRQEYYQNLTNDVCKVVEPDVQNGAYRKPIEYAQGMMRRQGFGYIPDVSFFDHGNEITPRHHYQLGEVRMDCNFAGFPNVKMSIYYQMAPLLNIHYVYLYLVCLPIFFGLFILIRRLLDRFQRQVVDVVQSQIKRLLGLGHEEEKPKGVIGQLLDLNIPLLGYLKNHIEGLEDKLAEYSKKIAEQKKAEVLSDVAAQVAHDIVMPISTLQQIISSDSGDSWQDRALIQEELEKVKALAEKMLRQYRGDTRPEKLERFDLIALVAMVVVEAKALGGNKCEIVSNMPDEELLVNGIKSDISSALSNIVKNAIEAIEGNSGRVTILVSKNGPDLAKIVIKDTGCGIAKENLIKIFKKDVSYKSGGTGLGLYQAKSAIDALGGKIDIESTMGLGTIVEVLIPILQEKTPVVVPVTLDMHLVFVDDDKLVHELWRKILPRQIPNSQLHFLKSSVEFRSWMALNKNVNAVFFIDHDLSENGAETGIQLIEEFGCHNSAYLLTGRAQEESIKTAAREKSIRVIDKNDQAAIQFRLPQLAEIVLIDDSRANRIAWLAQAKRDGKVIETFTSGKEFIEVQSRFDRGVPIYVDYFFDGKARGNDVAEELIKIGFSNVFLATAYPKEKIRVPPGIRGVVGKDFPAKPA